MDNKDKIKKAVQAIVADGEMNQKDLSVRMGFTPSSLNKMLKEEGTALPLPRFLQIVHILGVDSATANAVFALYLEELDIPAGKMSLSIASAGENQEDTRAVAHALVDKLTIEQLKPIVAIMRSIAEGNK